MDGEPDFNVYVAARRAKFFRTACLLCGDPHRAEDIVQDTLARLFVNWPRVSRADNVEGYVRRILVNSHYSDRRRPWRNIALPLSRGTRIVFPAAPLRRGARHCVPSADRSRESAARNSVTSVRVFGAGLNCGCGPETRSMHQNLAGPSIHPDLISLRNSEKPGELACPKTLTAVTQ